MSIRYSQSELAARRAELLAELFFQDLNPVFISRPTTEDVGYDLLVGFSNDKGGINTFAVQVKYTEKRVGLHFPLQRSIYESFAHSNLPGLLLVVDVKQSHLHYAWLRASETETGKNTLKVLVPLVEINETTKDELKRQFQTANCGVAAAG